LRAFAPGCRTAAPRAVVNDVLERALGVTAGGEPNDWVAIIEEVAGEQRSAAEEAVADAYVWFTLAPDGSIERMRMRAVSPATDFSFDFHHLDLLRAASLLGGHCGSGLQTAIPGRLESAVWRPLLQGGRSGPHSLVEGLSPPWWCLPPPR